MFRGISLANKCLLLFGGAVVLIVLMAMIFPFLRMNALVDEGQLELSRQMAASWLRGQAQLREERAWRASAGEVPGQLMPMTGGMWPAPKIGGPLEPVSVQPGAEENAGVLARRLDAAQARELAKTDEFLRNAIESFEEDASQQESQRSRWRGTSREYRYASAIRGTTSTGQEALLGVVMLERRSVQATRLLLINAAYLLTAGSLVLTLALLVFYLITHKIILSPVRALRDTAETVRRGDLTTRSDIQTGDEFEELAITFNTMLTDLEDRQVQLRAINAAMDLKMSELAEANVALYETARLKGEFLANVSHELRTPLNSIIGFGELLLDIAHAEQAAGDDSTRLTKRIRYVENIVNAAKNLLEMINSLLEMAKIEAGKIELRIDRISVRDLCEGLLGLIYPQANKKGLTLKLEVADDLPIIESDGKKLRQIVFNFLSNAVKFTPPAPGDQPEKGQVTLRAERLMGAGSSPGLGPGSAAGGGGNGDSDALVRISVIDTGPGIPQDEQSKIFEKFHQLDQGHTREHPGTGLGLAICKDLASLLQADLQVVSEIGRGSMFSVILPTKMSPNSSAEATLETKFRSALHGARAWN